MNRKRRSAPILAVAWTFLCITSNATPSGAQVFLERLDGGLDTQLIVGNGDLMAYAAQEGEDLVIGTSKNDVWDIRLETDQDQPLVPVRDIEAAARDGAEGQPPAEALKAIVAAHANPADSYHRNPYPSPRMTARWRIRLASPIRDATLSLNGIVSVRLAKDLHIRCYVHALKNIVVLEWDGTAASGPHLEPILDPALIPAAATGSTDEGQWLAQELPSDLDVPGITFAAATAVGQGRAVLAQASSLESRDPQQAAIALAKESLAMDPVALLRAHEDWWAAYWSKSSVCLEDKDLEQLWYRQVYFMGATIRAGEVSPGLFAPLTNNQPAWHGDYHTNYNIQQTYWSALPTNHPELMEPYQRLMAEYLPRAQWLAREIYGVSGAFYPHVILFAEPPNPETCKAVNRRQYLHIEWAYTLGVTSFTVQNLWWRYLYQPDRDYLQQVAYPVLAETARFYCNLLHAYRGADGKSRPPTVSPEHWGWTPGLEKNRNCTFDTALIAFNLKAAAQAAAVLGRDEDQAHGWLKALEMLPDYPRHEGKTTLIVDVENAEPIEYNIPIPSTVVFPGEQLTFFSDPEEKTLFTRTIATMKSNGNNDMVINAIARARLSMPGAYTYLKREALARLRPNGTLTLNRNKPEHRFNAFGHYTEMYGAAAAVSELLLQSVDGIIRVFPAWPQDQEAAFTHLRATGGFLVSASSVAGAVGEIRIRSTVGGACRLFSPWAGVRLGEQPLMPSEGGIIRFDTLAGETYTLHEAVL